MRASREEHSRSSPDMAVEEAAVECFATFLATVDTHVQRTPEFLVSVMECFTHNGVVAEQDLIGMRYDMLRQVPPGVHAAFLLRAVSCANERAAAAALPTPLAASDGMHQLAKVMRQEDLIVHINKEQKLSRTTLAEIPDMCFADGAVTDALATEIVRLRKQRIKYPFVFVDFR